MISFKYAFRQIFSPRTRFFTNKRVVGALIGMILSLVPVCVALVVVDGMIDGISERFLSLGDNHLKVYSYASRTKEQMQEAIDLCKNDPDIISAVPSVNGRGLISNETTKLKTGVDIKGFPADIQQIDSGYRDFITMDEGEFNLENPKDILLSSAAANQLDIKAGDTVDLLMVVTLAGRERPIRGKYTVKGIFSTGYYQLDNISVYMNFDRVYPLFKEKGVQIYLKTQDPYKNIEETTTRIRSLVNEESYWQVSNWKANNRSFLESLENTRFLIMLVMIGIVFITSFNIMSTFFMMVKEKESEIAILKSCGVSTKMISSSFVFSGFLLAITGTFLGIALGLIAAVNVNELLKGIEWIVNLFVLSDDGFEIISDDYYLETIPVTIDWIKVLLISVSSIFIAFLFTLIPVLRVSKIKAIDIIRKH